MAFDGSPAFLTATRVLAIDLVTAEVLGALGSAGVRAILLKGPSIALWLYKGGAGRAYVDTDILVSPDDWERAQSVLASHGFVNLLAGASRSEQDPSATPWRRERDGMSVDVHRQLRGVGVDDRVAWDILAAGVETVTVAGVPAPVLAPAARAVNLALHAAHDGVRNLQCREDLARAIVQLPLQTWKDASLLARRLKATDAFGAGLRLLPPGAEIAARLRLPEAASAEIRLRAMTPPPLALGFLTLQRTRGLRAKLRFIGENLVPTSSYMRYWSPLAHHGRLGMAAAYAWRWVALIRLAGPGYRAWRRATAEDRRHAAGSPSRGRDTESPTAGR